MADATRAVPDEQPPTQIQIVVTHTTHQITYYDVPPEQGWKVDPAMRCLLVGHGLPRTYVPLDTVLTFTVEKREVRA